MGTETPRYNTATMENAAFRRRAYLYVLFTRGVSVQAIADLYWVSPAWIEHVLEHYEIEHGVKKSTIPAISGQTITK
jgi:hypothetical protein